MRTRVRVSELASKQKSISEAIPCKSIVAVAPDTNTHGCVCKRAVAQQHMDVHCTMYMFTTTTKNKSVTVCVYLFLYACHSVQCTYMPAVNQRINKLLQAASKPTDQWQIGKAISGKMYIDQTAKMCVNHNIAYVCVCVRVK